MDRSSTTATPAALPPVTPACGSGRRVPFAGARVLPAALCLLLAACASYQPAPLAPEQTARQFVERRLDSSEVRERVTAWLPEASAEWPPPAWDRGQLLAAALVLNPRLAVARAQVDAALAHEVGAGRLQNPQLTLQSEYARHDPHPWLYGVAFDFVLASGERRRLEAGLAQLETGSARWQLMEKAWEVRQALIVALSDREYVRRRLALLDRLSADQQQLIGHQQRRLASGEDAADLLAAAQQVRLDFEQQQAQARADLVAAEAAVAASVGVPPAAIDDVVLAWPEWGAPDAVADASMRSAREQALRSRSDLAGAIAAYAASENRLQQAVLLQYPQIHLEPGYYWDHGVAKFPFNVAFDLPIFHDAEGEIAEAKAARDVAGRQMLAVQAVIVGAIDAAERAERMAAGSVALARSSVESAGAQRRNAAASLRAGSINAAEDLTAEIGVLRSELELLHARARLQAARNALEDALRAPVSGPELQLSQPLSGSLAGTIR